MRPGDEQRSSPQKDSSAPSSFVTSAPAIELPKGGGAIRGIGEKFASNPVTGTGSITVPVATSPGRSGFGPSLALTYDSGAGNGAFGFGWRLSLPSITRKTDKGLPQYFDGLDSDIFILSGTEDLLPVLVRDANGKWVRQDDALRIVAGRTYRIRRYRPRIEGLFARIERWSSTADASEVFWRSISKDNITTWYGRSAESRIADPADPTRIFTWLICQSHDDKGNVIVYGYKLENPEQVLEDSAGNSLPKAHERNRTNRSRSAQRYLKRIRYGNRSPYLPDLKADAAWPEPPDAGAPDGSNAWHFEVVLDYGEHDTDAPTPNDPRSWPARQDPFSTYRAGFEIRTYRICQRILMFHHFPSEAGIGRGCLVRSTDLSYSEEVAAADIRHPVYSFLQALTQTGYRRSNGAYDRRSLPPVEFHYTRPVVEDVVREVDPRSLDNLPIGLDGSGYRWTDLHGEGVPGILTEQAGAWYYKRNLSPLSNRAEFAPLETVALKPNVALSANAEFLDLAGDGQPDVVIMEGPTPGFYEHDDDEGWQPFRAFTARLHRDLRDPNLKFVDLDGDGHADVLITEDHAFVWHASLAEAGFGPARRVAHALDEEKCPRIVFADGAQSIYLADLSGDGLADIVRIRNGDVCYWPNLGYGRFGEKVTMDNAPWFDHPDQFDHERIRLADIDGSGTADVIYLHRDGVRLYFNQSGNSWSQAQPLTVFPRIDDLANIVPIDLLGNGTTCLVWSSRLPGDARRPMRYVNLMGSHKPHLLVKTVNNLGAETRVDYAPSTKFYLQDKRDGKPWITRLPFPVHVVERVDTYDYISHSRFVTRYAYHHGYFDGEEREFRGFGMVEQWDTEQLAALARGKFPADEPADASHLPPMHTKTWFHTGIYHRERVTRHFEGEYFREPGLTIDSARSHLLDDTTVPPGLTPEEEREACRSLKGSMLRQEVYADDAGHPGATPQQILRARTPYTVTEQSFTIRTLQARGANRHAVFLTHVGETISYYYEREPADPRIQHALVLEVDAYGNVLKQAAVAYPRRTQVRTVGPGGAVQLLPNAGFTGLNAADKRRQTTPLVSYTENAVTKDHQSGSDAIDGRDTYRLPLPCESITFELTGYAATGPEIAPAADPARRVRRYLALDFVKPGPAAGRLQHDFNEEVTYESPATANRCRRPIELLRTLYRHDDLSGLLPLGKLGSLALPGESYQLAFTPGLLDQVFKRPRQAQADQVLLPNPVRATVLGGRLGDQGGYVDLDGDGRWWVPSGRSFYHPDAVNAPTELAEARAHFFLPRRFRDPFGQDCTVSYDGPANPLESRYNLLMTEIRDVLGNRMTVDANDYRVLHPRLMSDPNGNRTELAYDMLGMVAGTATMGKPAPAADEGDSLAGFAADLTTIQLDGFMNAADPHVAGVQLLQGASTRIVYDLDRFMRTQRASPGDPGKWLPACAASLARETHVHSPLPPQGLQIQLGFSYSDGFGREIQRKIPAGPGRVPQRDATGQIAIGADDQPVLTAADANPRWVGSGWTVYNNKGKPVRHYEPFFTDTHRYEFDVRIGVSPVLFYDAAGRVIVKLHPNRTYEKVVFDPWRQTSFDVNDTCAPRHAQTGDPRTDPDIGGYVQNYFKSQPPGWQTWHARRIGGALGLDEQHAAQRAAAHADTPTTMHVDALGRPFLTVARNRVVCIAHPLDGKPEEEIRTRVDLDIEGNQRTVLDERRTPDLANLPLGMPEQRIVIQYDYDMLGNRIHQRSMEAGARWMLNDVAGKPVRAWDSRGHDFTIMYDVLRRPVEQYVRGTFSNADPHKPNSDPRTLHPLAAPGLLVDRIEYGEPRNPTPAQEANARRLNLRTRVYRHFDSAGVTISAQLDAAGKPIEAYDFKGNLLHSTRRLVSDYKAIPDWSQDPQLDAETFKAATRYDALNRPIQSIAPHSSVTRAGRENNIHVIQPVFIKGSLLGGVNVWLERAAEPGGAIDPANEAPSPVGVAHIDYDAKGQRTLIEYRAAGAALVRTVHEYDRETFRLTRLFTQRSGDAAQDLHYTYDPAGNITHIRDDAQQALYFGNQLIKPSNDYVYDARYRLIQADGREHVGQLASGGRMAPTAADAFNAFHMRQDQPNVLKAMARYTERYVYDAVGNFLQMQHRGTDPAHAGWTRAYEYAEDSLTEQGRKSNRLTSTTLDPAGTFAQPERHRHDVHGNMQMPHLARSDWDYRDRLTVTSRQAENDAPPPAMLQQAAYYVYDSGGQRVRKVCEKAQGLIEERIYLGGFEIFRRHGGAITANSAKRERETLHIADGGQRIALVEMRTLGNEPGVPQRLIRYQLGNHMGSACVELNEQAQIISYEEYSPYGSTTYQAVRNQVEPAKRYRFTGKERDEENGLYYHGARYYAPWLGRWASCDPVGISAGINLFRYVRNRPISRIDPAGTDDKPPDEKRAEPPSTAGILFSMAFFSLTRQTPEEFGKGMLEKAESLTLRPIMVIYGPNGMVAKAGEKLADIASGLPDKDYVTREEHKQQLQAIMDVGGMLMPGLGGGGKMAMPGPPMATTTGVVVAAPARAMTVAPLVSRAPAVLMMTPVGDAPSASAPAPQEASGSAGGGGNAPYGPPPPPKKLPEGLADDLLAAVDQGKLKASGAMLDDLTNWQQASAAKAERGLQHTQGAHVSARAAMRTVPAYDPKAAIVRLLDKVTHRGFDDYWKDVFFKMAKASGETKILVSDYLNVMRDAIGNNPYFTNEEARSMYELLKSEVHTSYGLKPTDTVRLPYSK